MNNGHKRIILNDIGQYDFPSDCGTAGQENLQTNPIIQMLYLRSSQTQILRPGKLTDIMDITEEEGSLFYANTDGVSIKFYLPVLEEIVRFFNPLLS